MNAYSPWIPGIWERPNGQILANSLETQYAPKVIAHITADRNATAGNPLPHVPFESLLSYFMGAGAGMAPHILWCPLTGKIAQFFPAWSRSLSVKNGPNGEQTNRMGKFVIQIEAVFFPHCEFEGKVYARLADTPCLNFHYIHDWVRELGIPDVWPSGEPTGSNDSRSLSNFQHKPGWFGHSQVPYNDHIDPMSWPSLTTPVVKPPVTKPPVPPVVKPPVPPVTKPPVPVPDPAEKSEQAILANIQKELDQLRNLPE